MASCGGNFKLTVCFDTIRIVVPCGNGELLVKDLTELAVSRYRKAIGKGSDYRVIIHNLRSCGGGILDQDDRLIDVVDDREQVIATFEEQDSPHSRHPGADGKSVSSAGTSSPDLFYVQNALCSSRTTETLGPTLNIEPVLLKSESVPTQIDKVDNAQDDTICSLKTFDRIGSEDLIPKSYGSQDGAFRTFSRSCSRKSLCGSSTMQAWLDAQDKLLDKQEEDRRKDPVGSSDWAEIGDERTLGTVVVGSKFFPSVISESWGKVVLENDGSALGIHVVPGIDENERSMGLLIQGIDPSGRVFSDGRLRVNDCIVEVNGVSLIDRDFSEAQEIFKEALQAPVMNLRIAISDDAPPLPSHSLIFKPNACRKPLPELPLDSDVPNTSTPSKELGEDEPTPVKSHENCPFLKESPVTPVKRAPSTVTKQAPSTITKQAPSTITKQTPSACQRQMTQSDLKVLTGSKQTHYSCTNLAPSSEVKCSQSSAVKQHMTPSLTGKGGPSQNPYSSTHKGTFTPLHTTKAVRKKVHVQLVKGNQGLGFSITTRDNTTEDGDWPVYIKHILPKGAAIMDGRLQPGDMLLEVNGIKMSNKTQNEVVNYLRNVRIGSVVNLVLSRQEVNDSELPFKSDENHNVPGVSDTDMFLFIIALRENGTESGLGISVKGKTVADDDDVPVDLGLFVKSVMEGGAAAKDGRLKEDDRLIEVNGRSLVGLANSDAMEVLRYAMETDGPEPGTISLVIAREKFAQLLRNDEMESISKVYERLSGKTLSSKKLTHVDNGEKRASERESGNSGRNCPLPTSKSNRNVSYLQAAHENTLVESTINVSEKCCQDGISAQLNSCNNESGKNQQNDTAQVCSEAKTTYDRLPVSSAATPSHSSNPVLRRTDSVVDDCAPTPPEWLAEWNKANHDVTYMSSNASPMEVDAIKVFSRDAIGRQSMSEKRKGHIDPRTSSFYQQIKITKAQNETQSTLKKAVSMESLMSQSNLATPKAAARSCRTRESLKKYTSVENLKVTEKGLNDAVGSRGHIPNDSFKAAMNASFKKPVTDCMETVNEEVDAEPADNVEKKKSKNPFKGLFRFGKAKKEEKTKTTEAGKEQNKQQQSAKIYDKLPNREARGGTLEEKVVRTEQERQKRLSMAQSNNDVDCKLKESMRRENHSTREEATKPYRSCHKNQTCDDHINSCDYQLQQSDYGSFGGSTNYLDGPYNRRGHQCGCSGNDVGGYYVNCHDLQTQHHQYDSCQDPYRCCGVAQTPSHRIQCCSIPARADPTFFQDAFRLGGFHPGMMPNEPCDRGSRCLTYGSHGPPHVIVQTPQHHVPGGNMYPLQHPKTPMMNVHKATPSVVVPHHVGDDLYCQDQCCSTTYAAPRHQYQHVVDPRYAGTLSRKFVNPSAQRFDAQKV